MSQKMTHWNCGKTAVGAGLLPARTDRAGMNFPKAGHMATHPALAAFKRLRSTQRRKAAVSVKYA